MPCANGAEGRRTRSGDLRAILADRAGTESDVQDRLARDGVSCTVCHQIAGDGLGTRASLQRQLPYARRHVRMGSARSSGRSPSTTGRHTIMRSVTGFEQVEAPHMRQSELCATCHTLITEAFDRDGKVIGSLPEQMNYPGVAAQRFLQRRAAAVRAATCRGRPGRCACRRFWATSETACRVTRSSAETRSCSG